jgi:hypothetical protein
LIASLFRLKALQGRILTALFQWVEWDKQTGWLKILLFLYQIEVFSFVLLREGLQNVMNGEHINETQTGPKHMTGYSHLV